MIFYVEKKYIVIIGLLTAGLLAGGLVLARQGIGFAALGADMSRVFGAGGQWVEIKPRIANSTGTLEMGSGRIKTVKAVKPVIQWCEVSEKPLSGKEIIINEVAWMGTAQNYSDEWMELKNVSGRDSDISGWQLQNKNRKIKISFGEGEILPAGGLYLLERTDDESVVGIAADKIYSGGLGNSNEALYLFDADCQLRDLVLAAAKWPAGDNAAKKTMARLPSLFWKTSAVSGGTPKAENN
ncbi:MAG: lamin tail domain-containing protein [Minisyncoccales bacterium]